MPLAQPLCFGFCAPWDLPVLAGRVFRAAVDMSAARALSRQGAPGTRMVTQHRQTTASFAAPRLPSIQLAPCTQRGEALIAAAHSKSAKKRVRTNERNRLFNMYYRERAKAAIRKAYRGYEELLTPMARVSDENELKPIDDLQSLAFAAIDKARVKGVYHMKTANRRKAKVSTVRKRVLMRHKLYAPPGWEGDPESLGPLRNIKKSAAQQMLERRYKAEQRRLAVTPEAAAEVVGNPDTSVAEAAKSLPDQDAPDTTGEVAA